MKKLGENVRSVFNHVRNPDFKAAQLKLLEKFFDDVSDNFHEDIEGEFDKLLAAIAPKESSNKKIKVQEKMAIKTMAELLTMKEISLEKDYIFPNKYPTFKMKDILELPEYISLHKKCKGENVDVAIQKFQPGLFILVVYGHLPYGTLRGKTEVFCYPKLPSDKEPEITNHKFVQKTPKITYKKGKDLSSNK